MIVDEGRAHAADSKSEEAQDGMSAQRNPSSSPKGARASLPNEASRASGGAAAPEFQRLKAAAGQSLAAAVARCGRGQDYIRALIGHGNKG